MENNFKFEISSIQEKKKPNIKVLKEPASIDSKYYMEELQMNKTIIINALVMIWIGIVTIIGCIIAYVIGWTDNVFITFSGAFIDFFSGTILYLVNNSTKTKNEYFKESAKVSSENRMVELIKSLDDDKFKQKQIEKLVDNYCSNK